MGQKSSKNRSPLILPSKKQDCRALLKKSFKNNLFSQVPWEIWKMILFEARLYSIRYICQTCWGFKELVEEISELFLKIALDLRREGRIGEALEFLGKSLFATEAIIHIGYAYWYGGFGLRKNKDLMMRYVQIAAHRGNGHAMSIFALNSLFTDHQKKSKKIRDEWAKKAFLSNDPLGVGYCYYSGLSVAGDEKMALKYFEESANEGNEFGQFMAAVMLQPSHPQHIYGHENPEKAFIWMRKSALQGCAYAQAKLGEYYLFGLGCTNDLDAGEVWFEKAKLQGMNVDDFKYLSNQINL